MWGGVYCKYIHEALHVNLSSVTLACRLRVAQVVVTMKIDTMELSWLLMVVGLLFAPTSAQTIGGFTPGELIAS